jgi:predicted Rossmann-fold nucleotide-binding protein
LLDCFRSALLANGMIEAKDLDLLQVIDEPANIVDAIFAFYEAREDLLSTQSKEPGAYL